MSYTGAGGDVRVIGDFLPKSFYRPDWDPRGIAMTREGERWVARLRLARDARFDYQLVVDGVAGPDPANPRRVESGYGGPSSELVMPDHEPRIEAEPRAGVATGTLVTVDEPWATPKVTIYLPPGYSGAARYPTLYTADGAAWRDLIRLPTILDNLIADGAIIPIIAVMIDAAEDRSAWYYFNPDYLTYLERVVAYVDTHFSTDPSARVHAGTSAGARASLQAGLERPDLFPSVALLSPSIAGPPHRYDAYFGRRTPHAFVSAGIYEGAICEDARFLGRWLHSTPVFTPEAHSFGTWRNVTPLMLRHFYQEQPISTGAPLKTPRRHR